MKILSPALFCALAIPMAPISLVASQTISYSATYRDSSFTLDAINLELPQFNPAVFGSHTLCSAKRTLSLTSAASYTLSNNSSEVVEMTTTLVSAATLFDNLGGVSYVNQLDVRTEYLDPSPDGGITPYLFGAANSAEVSQDFEYDAVFFPLLIGRGNIQFSVLGGGDVFTTGGEQPPNLFQTFTELTISMSYTYDGVLRPLAAVPEANGVLGSVFLATLGIWGAIWSRHS